MHDFLFSKIKFPFPVLITLGAVVWIFMIASLIFIWKRPSKKGESGHWTTKDIITIVIIGVICMIFNIMFDDRFIGPVFKSIPLIGGIVDFLHFKDFPLLFLYLLTVILIRKPGAIVAMIFIKYILEQLIFGGHGINPLDWPVAIFQALFVELYLIARNYKALLQRKLIFLDAVLICILRAVPPALYKPFIGDQIFHGKITTVLSVFNDVWSHIVGNLILFVFLVPLAIQVAKSLNAITEIDDDTDKGLEV